MERYPQVFTLQASLRDRFGDNGMISVVICRQANDDDWEIDTWLMSCRVLNRRVEEAMLSHILQNAQTAGISRLVGVYRRTPRNEMVANHYYRLGFERGPVRDDGSETWWLDTNGAMSSRKEPLPFVLE
jgi:FkbH-like protein